MSRRKGFTLVELLVAIAIIILLLGIVLAFRGDRESHRAKDAAGQLEAYLSAAKARAVRENRPISIRFISSDGGRTFDSLQLLDSGGDWMPEPATGVFLELPVGSTMTNVNQNTARQFGAALQGTVVVGDHLEIHDTTPSVHRIAAIDYATNTMRLEASILIDPISGQSYVAGTPSISTNAVVRLSNNYRYVRKQRPLLGEHPYQLPHDIVIRGALGVLPSSINIPVEQGGEYEIRFTPAGIPVNANGRIILWIEDKSNVAKPQLLAIYQTGAIKSHDVGPTGNEFAFTTDGR